MRIKLYRPHEMWYWLECTETEAKKIFPLLPDELVEKSKHYINEVKMNWKIGGKEIWEGHPHDVYSKKVIKYPACFNIDKDLKYIEPAPMTLPFSHMWNGYSPYELIDEIKLNKLEKSKLPFIISNVHEINEYEDKILKSTNISLTNIFQSIKKLTSLEILEQFKFKRCGVDPLFKIDQNFMEQINQTFTYLVCLEAIKILLDKHEGVSFQVNFGARNGIDVSSIDKKIICECFASVSPDNNRKLLIDTERIKQEKANYKYVIFYSHIDKPEYVKKIKNDYTDIEIIQLKRDHLIK